MFVEIRKINNRHFDVVASGNRGVAARETHLYIEDAVSAARRLSNKYRCSWANAVTLSRDGARYSVSVVTGKHTLMQESHNTIEDATSAAKYLSMEFNCRFDENR
jgi:hypothetical protein